jgi:hypothetical protein
MLFTGEHFNSNVLHLIKNSQLYELRFYEKTGSLPILSDFLLIAPFM